jgi:hypothetical protein
MKYWFENRPFTSGIVFIILFIAIEQIDARYFHPYMKEAAFNSEIECHDFPNKCWLIDLKQRAIEK